MSRSISYPQAVRLLGGKGPVARRLEQLTGGLAPAAAAAGVPVAPGLLRAGGEFVDLSHQLVRGLSERRSGLSRHTRTQKLEAAHQVLLAAAYFETLASVDLPLRLSDLELTTDEQAQLTTHTVPVPVGGREDRLSAARYVYQLTSTRLRTFVEGLAVWEQLSEAKRREFGRKLTDDIPDRACERYEELLRQLAVEFPEIGYWLSLHEHTATRDEVRRVTAELETGLGSLGRLLAEVTTGGEPDDRRAALSRAYRAALDRQIVATGDVPDGLRLPSLEGGYVPPAFRLREAVGEVALSDESRWDELPVRDGLDELLAGYLTSSRAVTAPLLVLGQPGSGKSVLTKVLAARLPAADFLPVRVVLREVPAAADLQTQIEYAVRAATGESVEWPVLARSAGDALPVVILDGFDELLQATGVAQTDYLKRVSEFQRRELDQERPVAVIVTSRTSVADRATPPAGTMALRLEPFDAEQVRAWLTIWNGLNGDALRARGLDPVPADAVLAHPDLAGQPLLLLMLALYDADGNALQRAGGDLRPDELYERLLRRFAEREVAKHRADLPDRDRVALVEQELRRLAVAAFAMFNRGRQWTTEADLEADLHALLGEQPAAPPAGTHDLRAPLRSGEAVLGRFFFVHRAQANRDDDTLGTYEFLHATFGEYLVARLTWQVLRDLVARESAATFARPNAFVDDDLLHALLSFAVLSRRVPHLTFLAGLAGALSEADRAVTVDLLIRLFRQVHEPRGARGYADYRPLALRVPARHAAYAANLVLLAVCVASALRVSQLYGTEPDPIPQWRAEATLWWSQLSSDDWDSIVREVDGSRLWVGVARDLELSANRDQLKSMNAMNPEWTAMFAPLVRSDADGMAGQHPGFWHLSAYLLCDPRLDAVHHAVEPVTVKGEWARAIATTVSSGEQAVGVLNALLRAWLLPIQSVSDSYRAETYLLCADIAVGFPRWGEGVPAGPAKLLLHRLTTDRAVATDVAVRVLGQLAGSHSILSMAGDDLLQCALSLLARDSDREQRIRGVLEDVLDHFRPWEPPETPPPFGARLDASLQRRAREALGLEVDSLAGSEGSADGERS